MFRNLYTAMKVILKIALLSTFIVLTGFISCGKKVEPAKTEQQKAAKVLDEGSVWGGTDNVEVIESPSGVNPYDLSELRLTFDTTGDPDWTPSSFSTSGADEFLATSNATWLWAHEARTDVITLENASSSELSNMTISETEIQFTFQIVSPGGRVDGLDGLYTLKLTN